MAGGRRDAGKALLDAPRETEGPATVQRGTNGLNGGGTVVGEGRCPVPPVGGTAGPLRW